MSNCLHGLPADECLICKTLGSTSTATQARPGRRRGRTPSSVVDRPQVDVVSRPQRSPTTRLGLWLVALVCLALAAWFVVGLVSTAFHVIALIAAAAAAAWLGYRVGHWRGRRHPEA